MLTRRQVLAGTAAGSIAAIASARGVAAAPAGADGFDVGFGTLQDGAAVIFHKEDIGFSFFYKLRDSAAQVFYKEEVLGQIGVFLKWSKITPGEAAFDKTWQLVDSFGGYLKDVPDAAAGFNKVTTSLAQLFIKYQNVDQQLVEDVRTLEAGQLLPAVDVCQSPID